MWKAMGRTAWVAVAVALLASGCEFLEDWDTHGLDGSHDDGSHDQVRVTILWVKPMPAVVGAGGRVNLQARCTLRTRFPAQQVLVKARRQVFTGGHLMADLHNEVWRGRGTYDSSVPFFLPMPAPIGWYRVVTTMTAGGSSSQKTMQFRVH
jgi:hypothetical protein